MRVTLLDYDDHSILVDGTSIDDNEGMVLLEYHKLEAGKSYIIKYDFFEK